jgi:O-antigen/teichoic acid export membrane protein
MSLVKKNIAANFISNGLGAILAIAFVPVYIHFLGIESYGLIGVSATLQGMLTLLDMGLSVTLNREMARLCAQGNKAQEMRNMVRTLELIYWAVAALIGVTVFAAAPMIAHRWVHASQLSQETITQAIRIMAMIIAVQWPFSLYSGGLLGLQRQVLLSAIMVSIALTRSLGAVFILWKVSPTIQAFFSWQIVTALLQTVLAALLLWRNLPVADCRASFQRDLLRRTWRFAAGMSGISVTVLILTQTDKVILSRLLSLELFGYYMLAAGVAAAPMILVGPFFTAMYPRFTQLVTLGDQLRLKEIYHQSCQSLAAIILPIAIVMAFFSREILFLWTRNAAIAEQAHLILSLLVTGFTLNGLMNLPYALQLAHGWTKLAFFVNVAAVILLVPLVIILTISYGGVGAAIVWVILNGGFVLINIQLMHRRLLIGEQWRWYFEDVGIPLVAAAGAASLCFALLTANISGLQLLTGLTVITLFIMAVTLLATPATRLALVRYIKSWRVRVENI